VTLEIGLVIRVALFGADVGLCGNQILTAEAGTEAVAVVGAPVFKEAMVIADDCFDAKAGRSSGRGRSRSNNAAERS